MCVITGTPRLDAVTAARARGLRLIALAGIQLACGRSSAKEADKAKAELRSWDATLELLRREQARQAVPALFAEQVRRAAAEGREQAETRLREAQAP